MSELVRKGREEEIPEEKRKQTSETSERVSVNTKSPGIEINLRGKLVEDGLDELERYLERAYSSGLLFVRIVHGKGTGKMREAVRNALKSSSYVTSFEEPKDSEGGAGVTVAKIAK